MLIISNPNAGNKQGPDFIRQHVTWFIDEFMPPTVVPEVKQTTKEGDAGAFALEYIRQNTKKDRVTILVSGGDTTIHEIIQHVESSLQTQAHLPRVDIALLPMGTANALYYSEFPPEKTEDICKTFDPRVQRRLATLDKETRGNLLSLSALCSDLPSTPLTIARSSIYDAKGTLSTSVFSVVVVSSCMSETILLSYSLHMILALHAVILHEAEALRHTHPGLERFKIAAMQNITRWSSATLQLPEGYSVYNPVTHSFEEVGFGSSTTLEGPFAYFLSTVNVDRLELAFNITPLASTLPAVEPGFEIIVVRPVRDPSIIGTDDVARQAFAAKLGTILMAAYQQGAHVKWRYGNDGQPVGFEDSEGGFLVEYLRAPSWVWVPASRPNLV